MARAFLFYNPLAGWGEMTQQLAALKYVLDTQCVLCDMTRPETYESLLFSMNSDDYMILCGGDGTLNRFVNLTGDLELPNQILYFPAGKNNDLARELNHSYEDDPFPITELLKDLPQITLQGRSVRFLTGAALRLPEKKRAHDRFLRTSGRAVRYTSPKDLSLTVRTNGRETRFDRVRMVFLMFGRVCCGGLVPAPEQTRTADDLTAVVCYGCGKAKARGLLRRLREGADITKDSHVAVLTGQEFYLAWNHPVELTVDGEPYEEVTAFRACRRKEANP